MGVMAGETEGHRDLGAGGGAATGPARSTRSARVRVLYIPQTDSSAKQLQLQRKNIPFAKTTHFPRHIHPHNGHGSPSPQA